MPSVTERSIDIARSVRWPLALYLDDTPAQGRQGARLLQGARGAAVRPVHGRHGRRGDQGRAARAWRRHALVAAFPPGRRHGVPRCQPRQAQHRARSQVAQGPRSVRAAAQVVRRGARDCRARRRGAPGHRLRLGARHQSGDRLLQDLGRRFDRPDARGQGLRRDPAGLQRHAVDHRRARRQRGAQPVLAGRPGDRPACADRHPRGGVRTLAIRQGNAHRSVVLGRWGCVPGLFPPALLAARHRARESGLGARVALSLRVLRNQGPAADPRRGQRRPVARVLPHREARAARHRCAIRHQCRARAAARTDREAGERGPAHAYARGMDPRSRAGRHSVLAGPYARRAVRAPAHQRRGHGLRISGGRGDAAQGRRATAQVRWRAHHGAAPAAEARRAHARSAEGSGLQRSRDSRLRRDWGGALMNFAMTEEQQEIERAVESICRRFNDEYWRKKDADGGFPHDFHKALAEAGGLGVAMPTEVGGAGLGLTEAAIPMRPISESGAGLSGASAAHMNIFGLHPVGGNGSQGHEKRMWKGEGASKMVVLARTWPIEEGKASRKGLSLFYCDLDRKAVEVREIAKMGRKAVDSNQLFIDDLRIPVEDRLGEEGSGFDYILHGMNPERILIAAEAIGLGRVALKRAARYANERIVVYRPIVQNQGIQHPLAERWMELEAANLMMHKAAWLYDQGKPCGAEANSAKFLYSEAGFRACETAVLTHGGMGYSKEFDVERYLREVMLTRIAPISSQLILCFIAEKVLGLPKSY